jgi:hypothetical protein
MGRISGGKKIMGEIKNEIKDEIRKEFQKDWEKEKRKNPWFSNGNRILWSGFSFWIGGHAPVELVNTRDFRSQTDFLLAGLGTSDPELYSV